MICPKCCKTKDKVIDSREARGGKAIRRRRECIFCGNRYTTYEEIKKTKLQIIKRDGKRESFDKNKMKKGLVVACQNRHISVPQIDALVDTISEEIDGRYDGEAPSTAIGEMLMERLEKMDKVAYVRFASVYRRFRDVNQFRDEAERLIEDK